VIILAEMGFCLVVIEKVGVFVIASTKPVVEVGVIETTSFEVLFVPIFIYAFVLLVFNKLIFINRLSAYWT